MENIFSSFSFSSQGLSVQRQRLSAVAKNIANANTTRDDKGEVYRREIVVVRGTKKTQFDDVMEQTLPLSKSEFGHFDPTGAGYVQPDNQTLSMNVAKDNTPPRLIYDPTHPDANKEGYVEMPNVNIVTEMVDMISAQRGFEANTGVVSAAKNMAKDSLDI
ncbi:MAG: flagellar basal body rod protein FlgC [Candidatus Kapaibacterium sp.]